MFLIVVMNLYTAIQKSLGLRESRVICVTLVNTSSHEVIDAMIGSAVFIEDLEVNEGHVCKVFRVKFETCSHIISTVITFGLMHGMPMTHHIRNEDSPHISYIAFI